jgi:hypoxanthine phosphoribosyltransferase
VRETLTWEAFGDASRELARAIADDGFRPDLILAIARGGLFIAGALGYALSVKNLQRDKRGVLQRGGATQHIEKG